MTALKSTLDPHSPAYTEAASALNDKLAEIDAELKGVADQILNMIGGLMK